MPLLCAMPHRVVTRVTALSSGGGVVGTCAHLCVHTPRGNVPLLLHHEGRYPCASGMGATCTAEKTIGIG